MQVLEKKGKKVILLGNEAVVRGALEAGVQFISTYPGTPASEIGNIFYAISKSKEKIRKGFLFEYSTNEKTATEAGIGASMTGLKTLIAMKHFGLNVALDAVLPFIYSGCVGPTVIFVSDDPSCHSSAQSEENSRYISYLGHIPTLEPSNSKEAKEFTKIAFELSKKFKIPVIVRVTTRVAHQRMPVELGVIKTGKTPKGVFHRDKKRFVTMPPRVLGMKNELLEKIEEIRKVSEVSDINAIDGKENSIGIITSGVGYLYAKEALKSLDIKAPILKLGFFNPLPNKKLAKFIENKKKVLIIEELEGVLEAKVKEIAKDANPQLEIRGKDLLPITGELRPEMVIKAVSEISGKKYKETITPYTFKVSKRYPKPCPGCPYWLAFAALKRAVNPDKVIWGGGIGCYMLAGTLGVEIQDYLYCMGSSVGVAHGIKRSSSQKLISLMGDGTFFHSGIHALINTVHNGSNPLIIIMDNRITAMTGQQPNPGKDVSIEHLVKACGVKNVKVIDPINQKEFIKTVQDFLKNKEVSVIISRRPCLFIK